MNVLMPCLLFTSVVDIKDASNYRHMKELIEDCWVLLVMPIFVVGSGMALGKLVAVLTGCPADFTKACVGAVAFANSTGMSITLLQVLSPALLQQGLVDVDPLVILPVYLLLYPMLQWTVGSYLFGLLGTSNETETEEPEKQQDTPTTAQLFRAVSDTLTLSSVPDLGFAMAPDFCPTDCQHSRVEQQRHSDRAQDLERSFSADSRGKQDSATPGLYALPMFSLGSQSSQGCSHVEQQRCSHTLPHLQSQRSQGSSAEESVSEGRSEPSDETSESSGKCQGQRPGCHCLRAAGKVIGNALVPPVIGSVLGLIVALIDPIQGLFVPLPGSGWSMPPLAFLFQAMLAIGRASVPVNMLVLGSNLSKGCDFRAIPLSTNLGILIMKMIVQPMLMASVIAVLSRTLGGTMSIWLVAMIVSCTPTANNIMVMVELSGQNKAGVTTCVFTQYMAAPVVLACVISTFLLCQGILMPQV